MFAQLTSIIPGRKGAKRSVQTANIDIEPEDLLHDDPIDITKMASQNLRFVERRNKNSTTESSDLVAPKDYFDTKFNAQEANNQCRTSGSYMKSLTHILRQSKKTMN